MEKLILPTLIFPSSLIIFFVLSVPLHEFFHLFSIRVLGGRQKGENKITWFTFHFQVSKEGISAGINGGGTVQAFFPDYLKKHLKTVAFLVGFSGGLGTAIVFIGIAFFLFFVGYLPDILDWIQASFLIVGVYHLIYGASEAMRAYNEAELIEE